LRCPPKSLKTIPVIYIRLFYRKAEGGLDKNETIKHKGLPQLYEKNARSRIRPDLVEKVQKILSALEAANSPQEMALPLFRFHALTGDRRGTYAVTVKANWRVTFRFHERAAYDVDLEDYH
jgi:toxin HigB-1